MQILMLFLIERNRFKSSFNPYISVLPTSFTHFLYWSEEEICCLPEPKLQAAKSLLSKLERQMENLNYLIAAVSSTFKPISWHEYKWAWCCVNTRFVFAIQLAFKEFFCINIFIYFFDFHL